MSIYQKFCEETLDEQGALQSLTLNYPDDFNFGYDVVDAIAAAEPEKTALIWCNTENEEHIFSFADIKRESDKMANVFRAAGLRRGMRVMLVLKRHYEYWFAVVALHKLGVTVIPATHMLTVSDYVYRIRMSKADGIVCTTQNEVPEKLLAAVKEAGASCILWTVQKEVPGFRNLTAETEQAEEAWQRQETAVTDPMLLYFTSGTTGYPKGVIHDFSYPLAHIVTAKYWQQAEEGGLHFTVAETGWAKASWGKLYGQTETTLLMANFKGMETVAGSMGTASPFYRIELRGRDGKPVPTGEIGEVVILPPEKGRQVGVFCGYLDNESQYRHVWRDGVYHTGDAAYMDETGRCWFHGRFDDIIKTGGYRVGPYEVENVLMEHPAVVECSVVGVPDPLRGQAIKAFAVLGKGFTPSPALELEIKDFCNKKLAEYKWIRMLEFVREMPKTISGKIRKTELRNTAS